MKIEKGIPMPNSVKDVFLFGVVITDMEPGDSFLVPEKEGDDKKKLLAAVSSKVCYCRSRHLPKWKFVTRSVDGGVRVWRIL